MRGFLGLSNAVPKGFTDIRVNFKVKTDVDKVEQLQRLTGFSPVLNTLTQSPRIAVQVQRQ